MRDAEKHRKDLDNAMIEFKVNPNSRNQAVLERAMRMYQTTTTAMEPFEDEGKRLWPPPKMDGILGRREERT